VFIAVHRDRFTWIDVDEANDDTFICSHECMCLLTAMWDHHTCIHHSLTDTIVHSIAFIHIHSDDALKPREHVTHSRAMHSNYRSHSSKHSFTHSLIHSLAFRLLCVLSSFVHCSHSFSLTRFIHSQFIRRV
jgi:hypothetical protein